MLDTDRATIEDVSTPEIAEGIMRVREGNVIVSPGYDGEYGKLTLEEQKTEKQEIKRIQTGLDEF
mgnify:CR=1 FL=1